MKTPLESAQAARPKERAQQNRTITLTPEQREGYRPRLLQVNRPVTLTEVVDRTILGDILAVAGYLPPASVDLLFADPPYNLAKKFNGRPYPQVAPEVYGQWLEAWLSKLRPLLKPTASIYICGDWRSSTTIHRVAGKYFHVRNRITWEREKGRGAERNWKNCSEDIWFCTVTDDYTFDLEAVKVKRRVLAPYTSEQGQPKDWHESEATGRYRLTHPSNIWTDITVPFWSMPENTEHPAQKPEKLLAKIILASSRVGEVILDPFLGSGTTSVVAKKLGRHYIGVEIDEFYCCLAEHRLQLAEQDQSIQGYVDRVFWERNSLTSQRRKSRARRSRGKQASLFR